jgi:hypothetical protein
VTTDSSPRRGLLSRFTRSEDEVRAEELQEQSHGHGATLVRDCVCGTPTTVVGRLRSVTLRPVANAPAVEAELYDGSGRLTLLFLGRRRIAGITPGRRMVVTGRPIERDGERHMVNPRYTLLPVNAE